jgi:hypothetical protein
MTQSRAKRVHAGAGWLLSTMIAAAGLSACTSDGSSIGPVGETPPTGAPLAGTSGSTAPNGAAATSGSGTSSTTAGAAAQGSAGSSASAAGTSGSAASTAGAGGASAAGSSAAAGSGTAAGSGAAAGSDAAAGGGGTSGTTGAAGAPGIPGLKDCMSEDLGPCGTFTTQSGTKIPLGSYGAVMERNIGKGFEVRLASGDSDGGASCAAVVASFGEDPDESAPLLDTDGIDFGLYTIYRPAQWVEGQKIPIITWGNGTCAKTEGYGALLRYVASQGFFVVAANSRWVGGGNNAMTRALDFAFAATADATSPYYNHLDTTKVGAMGHSQGGMATITAARDMRINTVIIFNGGSSAVKPYLAISGDKDIGSPTATSLSNALTTDPPSAYLFYHKTIGTGSVPGHLTLMTQPERVIDATAGWFKYQLQGDMESSKWFLGNDCKLCSTPDEYVFGQKGLK